MYRRFIGSALFFIYCDTNNIIYNMEDFMFSIEQLRDYLKQNQCDFEIIKHPEPIISTQDAAKYFDINKAVPTFILQSEVGLMAFIISSQYGKLDLKKLKAELNLSKLKFADRDIVKEATGYEVGSVPLIGHNLRCAIDKTLLQFDYIYGGSGDKYHTLKITPSDVFRLSNEACYL